MKTVMKLVFSLALPCWLVACESQSDRPATGEDWTLESGKPDNPNVSWLGYLDASGLYYPYSIRAFKQVEVKVSDTVGHPIYYSAEVLKNTGSASERDYGLKVWTADESRDPV